MLATEVPGSIHQLDRVERASSRPGRGRCVSSFAVKKVLDRYQTAIVCGLAVVGREVAVDVTAEHNIDVLEQAGSHVEGFCGDEFLCYAGEELDRPGDLVLLHQFL